MIERFNNSKQPTADRLKVARPNRHAVIAGTSGLVLDATGGLCTPLAQAAYLDGAGVQAGVSLENDQLQDFLGVQVSGAAQFPGAVWS